MANDVLLRLAGARNLIAERGLGKGMYLDMNKGCFCSVGAIGYTRRRPPIDGNIWAKLMPDVDDMRQGRDEIGATAVEMLADAVKYDLMKDKFSNVFHFNDSSTKEEVLAAFDKAIETAAVLDV